MSVRESRRARRFKRKAYAEFSTWADTYDRHWLNRYLFEPSHRLLMKHLADRPPGRALDVGCGTGALASRLAAAGWEVVGLDLCERMVRQARSKAPTADGRLLVVVGDSEGLPFARCSFDAVTCANSFHHYPHQAVVVREMFRVLRPGGSLLLVDGWPDQFMGRIMFDWIIARVEGGYVWHRESQHVRAMFQQAGFCHVRQWRTYSVFPILLTRGTVPLQEARPAGQGGR